MKRLITIALCAFLSQMCTAQVMMLFSQDSLTGIVSPLDVDSLFYWFAADVGVTDSLGGAIATDEGVGTWNDLSGNGHHVTQSTNGARPVYKATGGPGSKPCIQFDGSNDYLAEATASWWGSDDITVFVVGKNTNATLNAQEGWLGKFNNSGSELNRRQWYFYGENSAGSFVEKFNTYVDGGPANIRQASFSSKSSAFRLFAVTYTGVATTAYIDASTQSVTYNASPVDGIYDYALKLGIGANNVTSGTPGNFLQGSISEIIVYSRALSATERTAIENYLNRKYDLY